MCYDCLDYEDRARNHLNSKKAKAYPAPQQEEPKQQLRIGIDLDGVCYDFADSFREFLVVEWILDREECPEPTRWEFYEDWGFTLPDFIDLCNQGVDAGTIFSYGKPHEGTRESLMRLKDAGHTLHVITDRSFGSSGASEAATRSWLDRHELPFDSLTFSPDKTIVKTDVMIEDKLSNYDALEVSGCRPYLLDRAWNQSDDRPRRRVKTLAAFADRILT